ncbi:MAG TPA: glycosyl hydrolase family 8 [Solirubrobacteraceae bacterium]|nr:glycosyl hydrolase family 8 [Solirubrobacteraceae bacterium]
MKRLALVIVLLAALAGCGEHEPSGFLDRYVQDDGRVVRQDQGGDTVSEGQAYALLLAVAAGDQERFARVWDWTRTHLRRSDGLLAWRWADGHVVDDEPATDADLDTARALLLAGRRFHEPRYREAAMDLKRAIVDGETTWAADRTVLVAGPWARDGRIMVNPSYWSPKAFQQLGFEKVEQSSRQLTQRLLESALPPDWARVEPFGIFPAGPPSGGEPGYSYDALRVPIRLAESCDAADRRLAAGMWDTLRDDPGAAQRSLDGPPTGDTDHAAAFAGAAGAAWAAGDHQAARDLLDRADELDAEHPTYYGRAWIELTRAMLVDGSLGDC